MKPSQTTQPVTNLEEMSASPPVAYPNTVIQRSGNWGVPVAVAAVTPTSDAAPSLSSSKPGGLQPDGGKVMRLAPRNPVAPRPRPTVAMAPAALSNARFVNQCMLSAQPAVGRA